MDTPEQHITHHHITVAELFRVAGERMQIAWLAGHGGGDRQLTSETVQKPTLALIGHGGYVHPNRVQVLGCAEMNYLRGLAPDSLDQAVANLFCNELAALVVANGENVPDAMLAAAERSNTPLFTSPEPSPPLIQLLTHLLTQALAPSTHLHGVFLEVSGVGVLITGDAAIGKSELALELISRGHRLIADDVLEVFAISPDTLEGRCPTMLLDFMEVRGLGILNVRRLFGETAVKHKKNLKLIVRLSLPDEGDNAWQEIDRLNIAASSSRILGIEVPEVRIPVAVGRNLAVLVEVAVRNHTLKLRGYDATRDFAERQRNAIESGNA